MVKGISRRVIVVRAPDPRFFEQAIFLLREDALSQSGVSAEQVLRQARQAAAGYIRTSRKPHPLLPLAWIAAGAALASFLWLLVALF